MLGVLLILIAQVEPATKLPLTADVTPRTKANLARLEEPITMDFLKGMPLDDVLKYIQRIARKGPNDPGIPIYVDPLGLQRAGRSLNSTVTIIEKSRPLKDSLARALTPLGMAYIVKDDVLVISDPRGVERERNEAGVRACDASPATKALLARLEEPVTISFPAETPLDAMLDYLEQATARPPDGRGIVFLVVPQGLEEVQRTLDSTIQMDLEGVPLKTTLRLMLDQLGLACVVKDGRLVIHSAKGIEKLRRKESGAAMPRVGAIDH
jgi:hypothetical protein